MSSDGSVRTCRLGNAGKNRMGDRGGNGGVPLWSVGLQRSSVTRDK